MKKLSQKYFFNFKLYKTPLSTNKIDFEAIYYYRNKLSKNQILQALPSMLVSKNIYLMFLIRNKLDSLSSPNDRYQMHFNFFCPYLIYYMQSYQHFCLPFDMSNAFNSILSFELSQMCKSIEEELNTQLLRNQFLKNKNSVPPVKILMNAQEKREQNENMKVIQMPMRYRVICKKRVFECKIETKNLPKNFGKAIITYIQNNSLQIASYLSQFDICYEQFVRVLTERRSMLSTIESLRDLWLQDKFPYSKQMRELSIYFLRKHCFKYIFNSRVKNMHGHIKYRKRLLQALERPHQFTSIKTIDYSWPNPNKKQ